MNACRLITCIAMFLVMLHCTGCALETAGNSSFSSNVVPDELWTENPEFAQETDTKLRQLSALTALTRGDVAFVQVDDWGGTRVLLFSVEQRAMLQYKHFSDSSQATPLWHQVCNASLSETSVQFVEHVSEILESCRNLPPASESGIMEWAIVHRGPLPILYGYEYVHGTIEYANVEGGYEGGGDWRAYWNSWDDMIEAFTTRNGCAGGFFLTVLIDSSLDLCGDE